MDHAFSDKHLLVSLRRPFPPLPTSVDVSLCHGSRQMQKEDAASTIEQFDTTLRQVIRRLQPRFILSFRT